MSVTETCLFLVPPLSFFPCPFLRYFAVLGLLLIFFLLPVSISISFSPVIFLSSFMLPGFFSSSWSPHASLSLLGFRPFLFLFVASMCLFFWSFWPLPVSFSPVLGHPLLRLPHLLALTASSNDNASNYSLSCWCLGGRRRLSSYSSSCPMMSSWKGTPFMTWVTCPSYFGDAVTGYFLCGKLPPLSEFPC
jgi:hypothetical protein